MSMKDIMQVRNLTVGYADQIVVDDVSFNLLSDDILGLVGPNGAGKTTMFRAILGLHKFKGKITLFGYGPDKFKPLIPLIGYVPQKITFEPNFPATVRDVVSMGLISEKQHRNASKLIHACGFVWNKVSRNIKRNQDKVLDALKTVGLEHIQNRRIGQLSGGEQQRVFIAKSLVKDPLLMILDEPVTNVDMESQTKFYDLLHKLNKEYGIPIIWSSHDLDAVETYATQVACMNRKLFYHGTTKQFFTDEEALKTYTESTIQAHMHYHN